MYNIVFYNFNDEQLKSFVIKMGYKVNSRVTKNTRYIVITKMTSTKDDVLKKHQSKLVYRSKVKSVVKPVLRGGNNSNITLVEFLNNLPDHIKDKIQNQTLTPENNVNAGRLSCVSKSTYTELRPTNPELTNVLKHMIAIIKSNENVDNMKTKINELTIKGQSIIKYIEKFIDTELDILVGDIFCEKKGIQLTDEEKIYVKELILTYDYHTMFVISALDNLVKDLTSNSNILSHIKDYMNKHLEKLKSQKNSSPITYLENIFTTIPSNASSNASKAMSESIEIFVNFYTVMSLKHKLIIGL